VEDEWDSGIQPVDVFEDVSAESLSGVSTRDRSVGLEACARRMGALVHAVLEKTVLGSEPDLEEIRTAVRDAAVDLAGDEPDALLLERAAALAQAFWRSPYASPEGPACGRTEVPFLFSRGDTLVSGAIDLLYVQPGGWTVIDYKTNRLDGRRTEVAAEAYRLQGELYGLACLTAGAPAVTVAFVLLERPDQVVSTTYGPADRPALEQRLDGALLGLAGGGFPANQAGCVACWLHGLCMV
jgi:hypothetical protein